ncbi:unnamed protein product [Protopolystoma xenopodis]|uniref:Uncharacterized protein n=1 Tax=Protopolystoma xenopodis TaxID=117903 RepID=A0A3S5CHV2_9PLAT|nr:unnamed protein product [Protopolystoma xenopodis]
MLSPAARRLLSSSTASLSRPSTLSRTGDTSRPGTGSLAVSLTPSHLLFSSSPLVRSALLPHPVIRPQVASCLADQSSSSIDDCADPLERFKPDSTTKTGASVSADSSEENGASNNVVLLPGLEFKEAKPNEGLSLTDNLLNLKRLD